MRYIKDILLEKAILHVVDSNADEAIITSKNLSINENVEEFVRKHVIKSLNDEETFKGRFLSEDVEVAKVILQTIANPDIFIESSQILSNRMFNIIKKTEIPSGDMLFVQFVAEAQRCFGILKLDYQISYMHNILFSEEELCINLISQEVALPTLGQKLKKCVFFTKAFEDQIEMIIVDKKQKIDDANEKYFVEKYLEAVVVSDDTDKTRKLKTTIEKWTQKNLSDDIEVASKLREVVNGKLINNSSIKIHEIANEILQNSEIKENFKDTIKDAGYRDGSEFEIDKKWVEKKLKSKQIKTDTGITIRGEFDLFKDNHKFVIKKNGDGTVDYIIRNVRNVIER